jgi:uncharacterized damage-inducible protein DinB
MNRPPTWFDRKFDFAFPADQHPNLCARLRGTPARIEVLFRSADSGLMVRRSDGDEKWSAQEHAGHLLDLEALWFARVDDYLAEASRLTAADLSNRKTFEADYNQRPIEEILAEFQEARARLMSKVETVNPAVFGRAILHPRLKVPMRLVDHLYFVAEHDDHHLAYIWDLLHADAGA